MEGKDDPHQMSAKEFDNRGGKIFGLLIPLTSTSETLEKWLCWILDFVLPKALTQLAKNGVFGSALIKKCRYWPKDINRDMIKAHFKDYFLGHTDCFRMNLLEDNSKLDIHGFKEPDYIMMLMGTYGTIERVGQEQTRTWKSENAEYRTTFQYPELVHNHFKYRHAVDDNNNRRQAPVSIERTWSTNWWPHQVFAFLIAIT